MSPDALVTLSATAMASAVRRHEISASALLEAHLARIERFDPSLGAFRTVLAESAREEATRIDEERRDDDPRPLLGVPVAIKDSMDVAGARSLLGTGSEQPVATGDSEVVARLRRAGAIIIGKTNLPELAAWPFTSSKSWGRTVHPWAPALDPGGSSGGSAVAVAARLCALALGDDLGGSIRVPAANTGLFGLKPEVDRVDTAPHVGRVQGLGTYGPITRTVGDAELALEVLSGSSGFVGASAEPLRSLRIGVSFDAPIGVTLSPSVRDAVLEVSSRMTSLGHEIVPVSIPYGTLLPIAFFFRYFAGLADELSVLCDPSATERRTRSLARLGRWVPAYALAWARRQGEKQRARLAKLFEQIDVLVTPILTGPPQPSASWAGQSLTTTLRRVAAHSPYAALANMTGQPACALPVGLDGAGLPIAVQILGRPRDERTLLGLAGSLERAHPFPTIDDRALMHVASRHLTLRGGES